MNKKSIYVVTLALVLCLLGFFLVRSYLPNIEGVFTKYDTLSYDSIPNNNETISSGYSENQEEPVDTNNLTIDSLSNENGDVKINTINEVDTVTTKGKESIFHINTSYEKIPDAQVTAEKLNMVAEHQVDSELFSELLLSDEEERQELNNAFSENTIPYQSILKLLTIAGQDILLNEDNHISQLIIDAIGDSDQISVIYIVDRKGNISYSSHKTLANSTILSSLTNIDLESNKLDISESKGQTWVSIPIFHTYGKIGNVLININ